MVKPRSAGRPAGARTAAVMLAAVVIGAAGTLIALRSWPDTAAALGTRAAPVLMTVPAGTVRTTQPANIAVDITTVPPALAPDLTGVVTALPAAPGSTVVQGQPLIDVNGAAVRAAITPMPFYRPLARGDTGGDVLQLRALLAHLGYPVARRGPIDEEVAQAVASWMGTPVPASGAVFAPSQVIWIPARHVVIAGIAAAVGAPPPAAGSALISFAPTVTSAQLAAATPPEVASATVSVAGAAFAVHHGALALVGSRAAALAQAAAGAAANANQAAGLGGPADDAASTAQAAASTVTVTGTLTIKWSAPVVGIPTSSILTRADGSLCVVTLSRATRRPGSASSSATLDGRTTGDEIRVVASQTATGVSSATGLPPGRTLVVNPVESGLSAACQQ